MLVADLSIPASAPLDRLRCEAFETMDGGEIEAEVDKEGRVRRTRRPIQ